jgi:hypothetical protein
LAITVGVPLGFALAQPFPRLVRIPLGLAQRLVQLIAGFIQVLARLFIGAP